MQAEQIEAYLGWVRERGIRYPVRRSVARSQTLVAFIAHAPLLPTERALLDKMIAAMRLPANACAVLDMAAAADQLPMLSPSMVIILGSTAAHALVPGTPSRGQILRDSTIGTLGAPMLITHHPAALLASPAEKRAAWSDLQLAMTELHL